MTKASIVCKPDDITKTFNFTGLFLRNSLYLLPIYLVVIASPPDPPENITYEVIVWDDNNFTVSVSWINGFAGKVSRYIIYVSQADQPTTYDGIEISNNPNYKNVSSFSQ